MSVDYNVALAQENVNNSNSLSSTVHYHKLLSVGRNKKEATAIRTAWQKQYKDVKDCLHKSVTNLYKQNFEKPHFDLGLLPPYSFVVQFTFKLAQPYISRDEQDFYIIDNPIRTDKVLGLPYVAPTSWKGSLRAAFRREVSDAGQEKRLFGNIQGVEQSSELLGGRLNFFPTFFTQKSLEIINPHDRARRVGKNPILIGSVPIGAEGVFTLLYVPFDFAETNASEAVQDLEALAAALEAMFCIYGFGAKTSSGFGLAKPEVTNGFVKLNRQGEDLRPAKLAQVKEPTKPQPSPEVIKFRNKFPHEDFKLKPDAWRKTKNATSTDKNVYTKLRAQPNLLQDDEEQYQKELQKYKARKAEIEALQPPPSTKREFTSFKQLGEIAATLNPKPASGQSTAETTNG